MTELPDIMQQLDEILPRVQRLERIEHAAAAVLAAWEANTWTQGEEYVEEMTALRDALAESD
jgi:hypothetical protein